MTTALRVKENQIDRQEQIILTLRSELNSAQQVSNAKQPRGKIAFLLSVLAVWAHLWPFIQLLW